MHWTGAPIPDRELRATVVSGFNRDEVAEPNVIAVEATIAAFTHGESWLEDLRAYIQANREHAEAEISAMPGVVPEHGDATYLLWIDVSGLDDGLDRQRRALASLSPSNQQIPN